MHPAKSTYNCSFFGQVAAMNATGKYERSTFQVIRFFVTVFLLSKFTKYLPKKWVQFMDADVLGFFIKIIKSQMEERKKKSSPARHDFIDTLTQTLQSEGSKDRSAFANEKDLEKCIIANAFVMFFAGFDTTSTNSSLCTFFLAKNPKCQERLYEEIREAVEANGGDEHLDYTLIQKLPYLEACLTESMRAYPLAILLRRATKPYKIPGTDMVLPKDTEVVIPGSAFNFDPRHYETPEKFNPDHFSEEAVSRRGPYADTTFGK